jgi:hypothetical protein
MQEEFSKTSLRLLDESTRTEWPKSICSLWLSIRLEAMGEAIMLATALFVALCTRNAALAGLALTSCEQMTGSRRLYLDAWLLFLVGFSFLI